MRRALGRRRDAVALFDERARAHDPAFDADDGTPRDVAEICRRVDGLPLAIELAAARCALLSPAEIAERLDAALGALGAAPRDAPARQRTLRATIDWSHELLDDDEPACFARFAVFAGGATVGRPRRSPAPTSTRSTASSPRACSSAARRRTAHAAAHARDGPRVRRRAVRRPARRRRGPRAPPRATTSRSPSATEPNGPSGAPAAGRTPLRSTPRSTTSWPPSPGPSPRPDAKRALELCAALGRYWLLRNRYADAVDWIDRALPCPARTRIPCSAPPLSASRAGRYGRSGGRPTRPRS